VQAGLPPPFDAIVQPDGSSVSQITSSSESAAGYPLHAIGPQGQVLKSFGADLPNFRRDRPGRMFRTLAALEDGWLWSARFSPYEIELWHPDLGHRTTLIRDPTWFEPDIERSTGDKVHDIRLDTNSNDRLWVVISLKVEDWNPPDDRLPSASDMDAILDTVVEVIDTTTGDLVASARTDMAFTRWAGEYLFHPRDLPNGDIVMEIWEVSLTEH
jgi:hypothetical protein